jgi:hypothetical protein
MKKQSYTLLAVLVASVVTGNAHDHIPAGATASGQLEFIYGSLNATTGTYTLPATTYHLLPKETGSQYPGYMVLDELPRTLFPTDGFTFIALSDGQTDDAQPNHAPTGTDIWLQITSVSGPAGASFGFWDANWADTHNTPTQSFLTNTPTGGFKFELSEPLYFVDPADQDPYGHIHGRAWTVTQPGDYYVGFTLYDMSTVGPGGGPLEVPSQTYLFHFQGIPEPGILPLLLAGILACAMRPRRSRVRAPIASL